jgi:aspartate/methionine/tyrosine aminotransferase
MRTPDGFSADRTDKIMLLALWANTLKQEAKDKRGEGRAFISAGMGKPTYPINIHTVAMYLSYWGAIETLLAQAQSNLEGASAAIDYGDPRGDLEPRKIMSAAMSHWYELSIKPDNILFTVGGAGALRVIFETFNSIYRDIPKYRVITPFPHYTLYASNRHQLHSIDVMSEPGYQLTAKALQASIDSAYRLAKQDNNHPKLVLLCNPSNPLGTIIPESELILIADILRKNPELTLVLDEAYTEMYWNGIQIPSILKLAPDLKERTIILRSATKALSAAGERMAMLMAFNPQLMTELQNTNINTIGHAPRSAQLAYAQTMERFSTHDRQLLVDFYKPKVDFVSQKLQTLGAWMPDPLYKVEGTFYVMGDFSDLLGLELPQEAKRALGKLGKVSTSEELTYYLLFKESVMLAPGAYFGLPAKNGFLRITCSGSMIELSDLMTRLEQCLLQARRSQSDRLIHNIKQQLIILNSKDVSVYDSMQQKLTEITLNSNCSDCLMLKNQNEQLRDLYCSIRKVTLEARVQAGKTIYRFLSDALPKLKERKRTDALNVEWKKCIDETVSDGALKNHLLNLDPSERHTYKPWIEHLKILSQSGESSSVSKQP